MTGPLAPRVVVAASPQVLKGGAASAAGCIERLYSLCSGGDSGSAAEGCGLPLCGNAYKVSVTELAFCVIWHDTHSGDWLTAFATKGGHTEMVREVYDSLFFSSDPSFPLEGKCLEEAKGCTGQSANRMLHRGPDRQSAAYVIFASYPWTRLRCEGSEGSKGGGGGFAASFIMPPLAAFLFRAYSQRTADSRQPIADSRQPTADSR